MKYSKIVITLFGLLLASCAGRSANAQAGGEPTFLVSTKNSEDQVNVQYEDAAVIFDVHSPSGIGTAAIALESGAFPETIRVRLHLQGLENFRLTSEQDSIEASISSSDPGQVKIRSSDSEAPILPLNPLWIEIEVVSSGVEKTIPLKDGYFEVTLPKGFIQRSGASFEIEWIDFYR